MAIVDIQTEVGTEASMSFGVLKKDRIVASNLIPHVLYNPRSKYIRILTKNTKQNVYT